MKGQSWGTIGCAVIFVIFVVVVVLFVLTDLAAMNPSSGTAPR
jgi:hypothetical protein